MIPPLPASIQPPPRRDPDVAAIVRRWRELTSGRSPSGRLGSGEPTLVACSGGADSSALLLALAAATGRLTVAHVVHDLRPERDRLADRDAVRELARALALPFVEASISVHRRLVNEHPAPDSLIPRAADRNAEALARRLRYLALAQLAAANGLRFVATAHHAGDQLESILMALARGSGPHGFRGVAPSRRLAGPDPSIHLIRPMLAIGRESCERLCRESGWAWREDTTNADTTRLRAYMRHRVIPELRAKRPAIEERASSAAVLFADAAALVRDRAELLLATARVETSPGALAWDRHALRGERRIVLGELVRLGTARLNAGAGADRLGHRQLSAIVAAIRSTSTQPRRFMLRPVECTVTAALVRLRATT